MTYEPTKQDFRAEAFHKIARVRHGEPDPQFAIVGLLEALALAVLSLQAADEETY